jgi:hypothetical protein
MEPSGDASAAVDDARCAAVGCPFGSRHFGLGRGDLKDITQSNAFKATQWETANTVLLSVAFGLLYHWIYECETRRNHGYRVALVRSARNPCALSSSATEVCSENCI